VIQRIYQSWAVRHQHPANYALHVVGIPMAVVGATFLIFQQWGWGAFLFLLGYALQFLGHAIEGNEVGEVTLIKTVFKKLFAGEER